jgi:hypothetical protein
LVSSKDCLQGTIPGTLLIDEEVKPVVDRKNAEERAFKECSSECYHLIENIYKTNQLF